MISLPKVECVRASLDELMVSQTSILMDSEMVSLDEGPPATADNLRVDAFGVSCVKDSDTNFRYRVGLSFKGLNIDADENNVVAIGISQQTNTSLSVTKHSFSVTLFSCSLVGICPVSGGEPGLDKSKLGFPGQLLFWSCCLEGFGVTIVDSGPWSNIKRCLFLRSSQVSRAWGTIFAEFEVEFVRVHTGRNLEGSVEFEVNFFKKDFKLSGWNQKVGVSSRLLWIMKIEACQVSIKDNIEKIDLQVPGFFVENSGEERLCL
jgi:hypothetical protein